MQRAFSEMSGRPQLSHLSPLQGRKPNAHFAQIGPGALSPGISGAPQSAQARGSEISRKVSHICRSIITTRDEKSFALEAPRFEATRVGIVS
jgi:hypothetical protein